MKKFISILLSIALSLSVLPVAFASTEVKSGECGDALTWTLDGDGLLTISGTGDMDSWPESSPPWYSHIEEIKSLVIENGVTSVGGYAFSECEFIESVSLPESLTSIGEAAFDSCIALTSLTVPESVTSIATYSFYNCEALTAISIYSHDCVIAEDAEIPSSAVIYGYSASTAQSYAQDNGIEFRFLKSGKCGENLTWALDENGVLTISGTGDMYNWQGGFAPWYVLSQEITSVVVENGVTNIGDFAFIECEFIESVSLPEGITSIGEAAFDSCIALTDITLPESLTSIASRAFYSCTSLAIITLPDNIAFIGMEAFHYTAYYDNADNWDSDAALYIGYYLICAHVSGEYEIADGTKLLADAAFSDCKLLTGVTLPESVDIISASAFRGCTALISIELHEGIYSICEDAFGLCTALNNIYIYNSECTFGKACIPETAVIYGYRNSTAQTFAAENGNRFVMLSCKEHEYSSSVTKQATCTENGVITYSCPCGDSYTEDIPASEHSFGEWQTTAEPTLDSEGARQRVCSVCTTPETEIIPKLESPDVPVLELTQTESIRLSADGDVYIATGLSAEDILSAIKADGEIKLFDINGDEISDLSTPLTSGMTIKLFDENGTELDILLIILPGDIDGDGSITAADARLALRFSVGLEELSDWQDKAADTEREENTTEITSADARFILRLSVNLEDILVWLAALI